VKDAGTVAYPYTYAIVLEVLSFKSLIDKEILDLARSLLQTGHQAARSRVWLK
jgi:hypothetical protein